MSSTELAASTVAPRTLALDEEVEISTRAAQEEAYERLLRRLSHQSVVKHFDAYADVDWEAPEMRIEVGDPHWQLDADDPLGATEWYRSRDPRVRSAIGLHMVATFMKIGLQFESVLKRGLLEFAWRLPNGAPEFRYVYHEVIEEAQHSLMFQEFVNRTGFDVPGLAGWQRVGSRIVVRFARTFPELFFLFVLGGEDPIDHVQRVMLRKRDDVHPLLRRISQIHVTEEARHLSFARLYLRRHVPRLSPTRMRWLRVRTPLILGQMSQNMMRPSREVIALHGIPKAVLREAYDRNPVHRQRTAEAVAKVRELCRELGIITPPTERLWKAFHLLPEGAIAAAA
ncbi:MAG TPA: diiron oxygenase [Candidatus Binatia bacterium]|nr:diiron oxygenase [Candidatus Binatia bacterium]